MARLDSFASLFSGDEALASRLYVWQVSLSLLADNPFGIGYGTVVPITGLWEHNVYLMVMDGAGFVGLLGLLLFVGCYAGACLQAIARTHGFMKWMSIAALGGLATFALNGLTMEIFFPTYAEPTLLMLALGLATLRLSFASYDLLPGSVLGRQGRVGSRP